MCVFDGCVIIMCIQKEINGEIKAVETIFETILNNEVYCEPR